MKRTRQNARGKNDGESAPGMAEKNGLWYHTEYPVLPGKDDAGRASAEAGS